MLAMNSIILRVNSCYMAVLDAASTVNVDGFMPGHFSKADAEIEMEGGNAADSLYVFNGYLVDYAAQEQMLAWTLVFPGVYRVVAELSPRYCDEEPLKPIENVGHFEREADLQCPSGQMIVLGLNELGQPHPTLIEVPPGRYRAYLTCNGPMAEKHSLLEEIADYTEGDPPDWHILLVPHK